MATAACRPAAALDKYELVLALGMGPEVGGGGLCKLAPPGDIG